MAVWASIIIGLYSTTQYISSEENSIDLVSRSYSNSWGIVNDNPLNR
jgi:hypothetical protein